MSHDDGLFGESNETGSRESRLNDIENTVSRVESNMEELARSISGSQSEPDKESMTWPNADTPRSDFESFDLRSLSGTLAPGVTDFDFENGTVSLSDVRNEEMSNSLTDTEENYVRTITVIVDGPCLLYVPEQDIKHYVNEPSRVSFSDIEAKSMQIQSLDVVSCSVFAGTHPDMAFQVDRSSKQFRRMSWSEARGDYLFDINDTFEYNTVPFTTQEETVNDTPISSDRVPASNLDSFSINVLNLDDNHSMEIRLEGRNTLFEDKGGGRYEKWTSIDGWSERSPKVVDPNTQKAFIVDEFPFRLLRLTPRCATEGSILQYGMFTLTGDV